MASWSACIEKCREITVEEPVALGRGKKGLEPGASVEVSIRALVARSRRHNSRIIVAMLIASALAHPGGAWLYEATREIPNPMLRVVMDGRGIGVVFSSPSGIACGDVCTTSGARGSLVKLTATIGEGSTFEGWEGPCGSRGHELFAWAKAMIFPNGRGLGGHVLGGGYAESEGDARLLQFLIEASLPPLAEYPLECEVFLDTDVEVRAKFGRQPERVDVVMEPFPSSQSKETAVVALSSVPLPPEEILDITKELEKISDPEVEPEPVQISRPTPAAAPLPPPPAPKIAATPKMKSVEVADDSEVKDAPEDARFLSDKNRDVAEETRATETNLEKQSDGERVASEDSEVDSKDVGAKEEKIAQLDELEETSLDANRDNDEAVGSESGSIAMKHSGEAGKEGDDGEAGDDTPSKTPGLLSMRNIAGRGAPGGSGTPEAEMPMEAGSGGASGRRGKKGHAGPKLQFAQEDYERIVGKEISDSERAVARHRQSSRRGRWERKLAMLKSTLDNFTPEVRAGNQTALKTRAAPFALYIARMHRRIHELWGFGFLEELERKPASYPLNDRKLVTKLEIVINPDGSIDKMTIVKPSGLLSFDVAALDVVDTSSPYLSTPAKIRSPDGKVYMHWSFHRDRRQCGTFGAEPFILSSAPSGGDRGMDDSKLLRSRKRGKRAVLPGDKPSRNAAVSSSNAAAARASANLATPRDPAAQHLANLWLGAFVAGDFAKLARLSGNSFHSGGRVVAKGKADIAAVYRTVIAELPSRKIRGWKLLSAAGYRQRIGTLPRGLDSRGSELFLVVQMTRDQITLVVEPSPQGYQITGLYR